MLIEDSTDVVPPDNTAPLVVPPTPPGFCEGRPYTARVIEWTIVDAPQHSGSVVVPRGIVAPPECWDFFWRMHAMAVKMAEAHEAAGVKRRDAYLLLDAASQPVGCGALDEHDGAVEIAFLATFFQSIGFALAVPVTDGVSDAEGILAGATILNPTEVR